MNNEEVEAVSSFNYTTADYQTYLFWIKENQIHITLANFSLSTDKRIQTHNIMHLLKSGSCYI